MTQVRCPEALRPLLTPRDRVHPAPHNPRTGHAVDGIARSLVELGWHAPLVAREDGELIIGHGRLAAAESLGLEELPVLFVDDDRATSVARMVADNRLTELSTWDVPELEELLGSVPWLDDWAADLSLRALLPDGGAPPQWQDVAPDPLEDPGPDLTDDAISERVILVYRGADQRAWVEEHVCPLEEGRVIYLVRDLV